MLDSMLSNVPAGTADLLSYLMLVVVAIFLVSGPAIVYFYKRKEKKMRAASPTGSA